VSDPHNDHLDRWEVARNAFKAATGRDIEAYALVLVDSTGEVYYGGNFAGHHKALLLRLSAMTGDLKAIMAKAAATQEQETDGIASRAPGPFAVTDAESGAPAVAAHLCND
jgi:hypothetical protein